MNKWTLLIAFFILALFSCGNQDSKRIAPPKDSFNYIPQHLTSSIVYAEIMRHEIKFADIVLRQAILETGWFTSYNCKERNNLFGMKGGEKTEDNPNGYAIYENWTHSVAAYLKWQRRMYGDSTQEYYKFLHEIGYAESSEYISKLKSINLVIIKV